MVHRSTIHVFPFFNGSEFHRRVNSRRIKLFAVDQERHSHHHAHVDVELANPHDDHQRGQPGCPGPTGFAGGES